MARQLTFAGCLGYFLGYSLAGIDGQIKLAEKADFESPIELSPDEL
jgi:hypothetical protein